MYQRFLLFTQTEGNSYRKGTLARFVAFLTVSKEEYLHSNQKRNCSSLTYVYKLNFQFFQAQCWLYLLQRLYRINPFSLVCLPQMMARENDTLFSVISFSVPSCFWNNASSFHPSIFQSEIVNHSFYFFQGKKGNNKYHGFS